MSSYRIEALADHEWGYRAAVRLMWHHRWVVLLLTVALMVLSNLGAVPLDEWIITEFLLRFDLSRFGHRITLYSLIILPIVTVSLISLLLKSEGITTSWRARTVATLILVFLSIAQYVALLGYDIAISEQDHHASRFLITGVLLAITIPFVTFAYCLCPQILVDGSPNLKSAYQGVRRRWLRLWVAVGLVYLVGLFSGAMQIFLLASISVPSAMFYLLYAVYLVLEPLGHLAFIGFAVHSTIWFLHPRVQPPAGP